MSAFTNIATGVEKQNLSLMRVAAMFAFALSGGFLYAAAVKLEDAENRSKKIGLSESQIERFKTVFRIRPLAVSGLVSFILGVVFFFLDVFMGEDDLLVLIPGVVFSFLDAW